MTQREFLVMEEIQAKATAEMNDVLAGTVWLIQRAQNTIADILNLSVPPHDASPNKQIAINLLVRIYNELSAVLLVCQNGFPLQAYAPASVIYEASWTVAAIGDNNEAAAKWFNHDSDKKSFDRVLALTTAGVKNLSGKYVPIDADKNYSVYSDLCMAKHLNPMVQQYEGFTTNTDTGMMTFQYGPKVTKRTVKQAWWVMSSTVRFMYAALEVFIKHFVTEDKRSSAWEKLDALASEHTKLDVELYSELKKNGLVD